MKMVDVWLFFNLLIPFTLIIIHTYMEKLRYTYIHVGCFERHITANFTRNEESQKESVQLFEKSAVVDSNGGTDQV